MNFLRGTISFCDLRCINRAGRAATPKTEKNPANRLQIAAIALLAALTIAIGGCAARRQPSPVIANQQPTKVYHFHYEAPKRPTPTVGDVKLRYNDDHV